MRAPSVLPCARAWRVCLSAAPTATHHLQCSSRTFFSLAFSAASSLVALRAWRCSDLAVNCEVECQLLRWVRHGKLARIVLLLHCRHLGSSTQDKSIAADRYTPAHLAPGRQYGPSARTLSWKSDSATPRAGERQPRAGHVRRRHTHSRGRSCWAGGRREEQQRGWCAGQRECAARVCCVLAEVRGGLRRGDGVVEGCERARLGAAGRGAPSPSCVRWLPSRRRALDARRARRARASGLCRCLRPAPACVPTLRLSATLC
jgi:hypothetical protein